MLSGEETSIMNKIITQTGDYGGDNKIHRSGHDQNHEWSIHVHDTSRRQLAHCKDFSSYNISGSKYHGGFSLEYIDVDDQNDKQMTCEWILRAKFIITQKSGCEDWGYKFNDCFKTIILNRSSMGHEGCLESNKWPKELGDVTLFNHSLFIYTLKHYEKTTFNMMKFRLPICIVNSRTSP